MTTGTLTVLSKTFVKVEPGDDSKDRTENESEQGSYRHAGKERPLNPGPLIDYGKV